MLYSYLTKIIVGRLPTVLSTVSRKGAPTVSCITSPPLLSSSLSSSSSSSSSCYNIRRSFASKVSALSLNSKKRKGKKITMVTAYDFPSAAHVARAGIDIILVGDSVAMVELGHETTQNVSLDSMIHHCQSVKKGIELADSGSMLIGDMPFGTYEFNDTDIALRNAYRFVKESGCDAVKLEVCKKQYDIHPLLYISLYIFDASYHTTPIYLSFSLYMTVYIHILLYYYFNFLFFQTTTIRGEVFIEL
jgi:hypothetical protein